MFKKSIEYLVSTIRFRRFQSNDYKMSVIYRNMFFFLVRSSFIYIINNLFVLI